MNKWIKFKETTQVVAVLMLDSLAKGFAEHFKRFHDGKTEIKKYGQMLGGRWLGARDIRNYEKMMAKAAPGELLRWAKEYRTYKSRLLKFSLRIARNDFKRFAEEKLANFFSKYIELCAKAYPFAYDYVMLNKTYSEKIMRVVFSATKNDVNAMNYYLPHIAGLDAPTDMYSAQKELGKITIYAKEYKFGGKTKEKIKNYCERYGYLNMFSYYGEPYSKKEIAEKVKSLAKKNKEEIMSETNAKFDQLEANRKGTKEFLGKYKINKKDQQIVAVLKEYIYTSMWADELYHRVPYLARPMLKEISRRLGVSYKQVIHMTADEILESLVANRVPGKLLGKVNERAKEFSFLYDNRKVRLLSGKELKKFTEKILRGEKLPENIKELKGQSAFPGEVEGTVQVIRKMDDIKNFKRGRILVSASTAPVHVPAMERASAIITDEGGLLSHAAIVSREFKKPCVVGTKIATKLLKSGDVVKANANNGLVKIIKK